MQVSFDFCPNVSRPQARLTYNSGGTDGVTCGEHWYENATWDGSYGVGQQMSALSVIQSNLIGTAADLVTNTTGGTSRGNPSAGTSNGEGDAIAAENKPVTTAGKAGAGIITALVLAGVIGGVVFMAHDGY